MSDISSIDPNFKVETKLNVSNIQFHNALNAPFQIHGVFYENGLFRRLPKQVAITVSEGVCGLHARAAGGRVRFRTDSPYIAIHAKMPTIGKMPHFALTGSAGFDLYADNKYISTFILPFNTTDGYENMIQFNSREMREITINMPLYSSVKELYIGLKEGSELCAPKPYKIETPIVYYGSSVTQGGCASRPGMAYQSIISRRIDADYINLGFSGSAKGEDEIAEYISGLKMSCFVYDYDYNAPTVEHLESTHEKMFKRIRQSHPDIPIVILTRPKFYLTNNDEMRVEVIKKTYNNAIANGDENVYLIEGRKLMEFAGNEGTVDGIHPTDFGFMSMARCLGDMLEEIFK